MDDIVARHASGLPSAFLTTGSSSFTGLLRDVAPDLLPENRQLPPDAHVEAPHGTTIIAMPIRGGVLVAGDRRATMGSLIAKRDLRKVYPADEYSCVAIAGSVGTAVEMVRLFQMELEHYEKIEGTALSLDGKANRLSTMIRDNLALAMQGLVVVPLFAGYDLAAGRGRVFSFDVTGGCSEERGFHCEGSGSIGARGALKKLYREDLDVADATLVCVQALYDAADEDSATGGPDLARGILPVLAVVDEDGYRELPEADVEEAVRIMLEGRRGTPDGPRAPLR